VGVADDLVRKMVAEVIGTFILVFAGTGTLILGGNYVFAFGFALIAIVYAIGHISGAHVNPAVTLGLALTGRFPMAQVPYYWASQVIGALIASLVLRLLYGNLNNLGTTQVAEGYSTIDGFVLELLMTAILVFVVHAAATDERAPAAASGLAIGGTLLLIHLVAGEVSGGSVNPARSLAPAIVSGTFSDLWIYLIAPFIGAVIGAVGYEFIRGLDDSAVSARVGTTAESQRRQQPRRWNQRPESRELRGDPDQYPESEWQAQSGREERPARRDRQQRPDRREREQREPRMDQGDVAPARRERQPRPQRSEQRIEQRIEETPVREAREPREPRIDQGDVPPQRRPRSQRPEQRSEQRQRRPPVEYPEE
jgi:MIP family channel proteins